MNIGGTKVIATVLSALILSSPVFAGDREWATAGKVLTGVAAITVIDRIVNPPQPVVYQQPVIVQPAQVVQPAPVVYVQQPSVVYVQPAPVYYPAPVIVYGGYGHYHYHGHFYHH